MSNVKVAINGFGRIGRLAFRQMFGADGYEVVAINDLTSPKMLAHLLKYDTAQGSYVAQGHTVTYKDSVLGEDGKTVVVPGSITVDAVSAFTGFNVGTSGKVAAAKVTECQFTHPESPHSHHWERYG